MSRQTPLDPRTPVIVGGGQVNQRTAEGDPAREPVDLIVEATERARKDTGLSNGRLLQSIDAIRVVSLLSWRYRDPGALVGQRLGASPRQTALTTPGGNTPQSLVNRTAVDILEGRNDIVLIGGAEAWRTRMSFRSTGDRPEWTTQDDSVPEAEIIGHEFTMTHPAEMN